MGGNKVFYTIGGKGIKPDQDYRHADAGRFTKGSRGTKAILAHQTRINKTLSNNTLRNMTPEELLEKERLFKEAQARTYGG